MCEKILRINRMKYMLFASWEVWIGENCARGIEVSQLKVNSNFLFWSCESLHVFFAAGNDVCKPSISSTKTKFGWGSFSLNSFSFCYVIYGKNVQIERKSGTNLFRNQYCSVNQSKSRERKEMINELFIGLS